MQLRKEYKQKMQSLLSSERRPEVVDFLLQRVQEKQPFEIVDFLLQRVQEQQQPEVEQFIGFLFRSDEERWDYTRAAEASFSRVWDNDDDAIYDTYDVGHTLKKIQQQVSGLPSHLQEELLNYAMQLQAKAKTDAPPPASEAQRRQRLAEALEKAAALDPYRDITDPVEWQREQRRDRPLPGREHC